MSLHAWNSVTFQYYLNCPCLCTIANSLKTSHNVHAVIMSVIALLTCTDRRQARALMQPNPWQEDTCMTMLKLCRCSNYQLCCCLQPNNAYKCKDRPPQEPENHVWTRLKRTACSSGSVHIKLSISHGETCSADLQGYHILVAQASYHKAT